MINVKEYHSNSLYVSILVSLKWTSMEIRLVAEAVVMTGTLVTPMVFWYCACSLGYAYVGTYSVFWLEMTIM